MHKIKTLFRIIKERIKSACALPALYFAKTSGGVLLGPEEFVRQNAERVLRQGEVLLLPPKAEYFRVNGKELSMEIKPFMDKIVIKVIEDNEKTQGGIFIPDSAKEKPQKGEVVAVGAGRVLENGQREPIDVNIGDVILYAKYSGTDIKIDNVEYKILPTRDVLAAIQQGELGGRS